MRFNHVPHKRDISVDYTLYQGIMFSRQYSDQCWISTQTTFRYDEPIKSSMTIAITISINIVIVIVWKHQKIDKRYDHDKVGENRRTSRHQPSIIRVSSLNVSTKSYVQQWCCRSAAYMAMGTTFFHPIKVRHALDRYITFSTKQYAFIYVCLGTVKLQLQYYFEVQKYQRVIR